MATLKPFRVEGSFKMGMRTTPFSVETVGADAQAARERVLSTLGSKHRVDRHRIKIDGVKELTSEEVTDSVVEHRISKGA